MGRVGRVVNNLLPVDQLKVAKSLGKFGSAATGLNYVFQAATTGSGFTIKDITISNATITNAPILVTYGIYLTKSSTSYTYFQVGYKGTITDAIISNATISGTMTNGTISNPTITGRISSGKVTAKIYTYYQNNGVNFPTSIDIPTEISATGTITNGQFNGQFNGQPSNLPDYNGKPVTSTIPTITPFSITSSITYLNGSIYSARVISSDFTPGTITLNGTNATTNGSIYPSFFK